MGSGTEKAKKAGGRDPPGQAREVACATRDERFADVARPRLGWTTGSGSVARQERNRKIEEDAEWSE
jgi:hypothetical protein